MEILVAFLVVGAIAAVAGILLALISHFFVTPEDQAKKRIRDCLPGINCGACGYGGCDDYAAALVKGEAKPNLCIPGAQEVADRIGEIIGVKAEPFADLISFIACNGHCDATYPKAIYEGVQSCYAASMIYGGANSCRFGCLGYGDCAEACPSEAICIIDGIAHVDTSRCIGCGLCARTCPKKIAVMLPRNAVTAVMCSSKDKAKDARRVCKNSCIGCKKCQRACPHGAIIIKDNLATIDYTKCNFCGACIDVCPTGCIRTVYFPTLPDGVSFNDVIS